jgi:hypothetical protein
MGSEEDKPESHMDSPNPKVIAEKPDVDESKRPKVWAPIEPVAFKPAPKTQDPPVQEKPQPKVEVAAPKVVRPEVHQKAVEPPKVVEKPRELEKPKEAPKVEKSEPAKEPEPIVPRQEPNTAQASTDPFNMEKLLQDLDSSSTKFHRLEGVSFFENSKIYRRIAKTPRISWRCSKSHSKTDHCCL